MENHINWIKCSEELPQKSGWYMVVMNFGDSGAVDTVAFSARHQVWNAADYEETPVHAIENVSHWTTLCLPEGLEALR